MRYINSGILLLVISALPAFGQATQFRIEGPLLDEVASAAQEARATVFAIDVEALNIQYVEGKIIAQRRNDTLQLIKLLQTGVDGARLRGTLFNNLRLLLTAGDL